MDTNKRLKSARESAGLTQDELSAASDVPQATLSAYECGAILPTAERLERIRIALDARDNADLGYIIRHTTVRTVSRYP